MEKVGGEGIYLEDRPIHTPAEDRLRRSRFAERLARSLLSWVGEESIVVALYGTWGSGKSSILNLTEHYLDELAKEHPEKERPIVLRFNPWYFSGQGQLISTFFHQVAASLRMREPAVMGALAKHLERYGRVFEPLGGLGGGPWGMILAKLPSRVAQIVGTWAKQRSQDLTHLRQQIDKNLRETGRRLVIIMDDLDRLAQPEIKQMFQLVKLNADFPNTTYVLAFDPAVVRQALTEKEVSGQVYLEKIVQVAFELPAPETELLFHIFFEQLHGVLAQVPQTTWDERRWVNLFHAGLKGFFSNVRDIKRFINALRLNYGLVAGEVNAIDFIGVEALRVFVPEAYLAIAQNKGIFVGPFISLPRGQPVSDRLDELLSKVVPKQKDAVRRICGALFPLMGSRYAAAGRVEWRRQLRICAPDMFERYFLLGIPTGEISEVELESLLELAGEPEELASALRELIEQGRVRRFLERMADYTDQVSVDHIESLCLALLNIGDELPVEKRGFSDFGPHLELMWVVYPLLKRLPDPHDVCDLLVRILSDSTSVFTPTNVVSHLTYLSEKEEPSDLVLNSSQLQRLQELCVEKIQMARNQSSLQKVPHLNVVLFHWNEWGDPAEVRAYVADLIVTVEGVTDFLVGFLTEVMSSTVGEHFIKSEWTIDLDSVAKYVEIEVLTEKITGLGDKDLASLSERQRLAIDTFKSKTGGIEEETRS